MLKRLELVGFKSFSQKTVLDFPKGIAVIVGPNGSGKSNIIDAIKWILGEREAKNLRSPRAEDLIFSGTSEKTRLGLAQVSLCLDNSAQSFPIEYNDIVITRKIARDGTAECLLNKSETRLKDIVSFFAQSRLGTQGLTIINQGNSDLFVKASPKERREMMEEILGLRQYQIKKHEASLKLKSTAQNLEKSRAVVGELLPHLKLLRRQVNKWNQSLALTNQLKELENGYFSFKIQEVNAQNSNWKEKIGLLDKNLKEETQTLQDIEAKLSLIEREKPARNNDLQEQKMSLQKTLGGLEVRLETFEKANRIATHKSDDLLALIKKLRELISKETPLVMLAATIDNFFAASEPARIDHDSQEKLLQELDRVRKDLEKIGMEEEVIMKRLDTHNQEFKTAYITIARQRNKAGQLESEKNQLILEQDRWLWRWQELEKQILQAGRQKQEFDGKSVENFSLQDTEKQLFRLRQELAVIGEPDPTIVKEAEATEDRYQFLFGQSADLEKALVDLSNLISSLNKQIHSQFNNYLQLVNEELNKNFRSIFNEGKAKLVSQGESSDSDENGGLLIEVNLPRKGVRSIEALSGGEKSLVSLAVLFSLIAVTPPPFLVLDEVDAALDEHNSRQFADLVKTFSNKTQFIIVTHNRSVMEIADRLYGVTMGPDGVSKILSLKLKM